MNTAFVYAHYDDEDLIVGDGEVEFRYPLDPEAVSMLFAALAEAGVLEVDQRNVELGHWFGPCTRYVSQWKEAK